MEIGLLPHHPAFVKQQAYVVGWGDAHYKTTLVAVHPKGTVVSPGADPCETKRGRVYVDMSAYESPQTCRIEYFIHRSSLRSLDVLLKPIARRPAQSASLRRVCIKPLPQGVDWCRREVIHCELFMPFAALSAAQTMFQVIERVPPGVA
ncbi:MAG TPA: hypothetical protein VLA19_19565 [Herpetosiphonaceae bacterium]|nr:hypothetical protein [Herpetosiphonaceae bacterium]